MKFGVFDHLDGSSDALGPLLQQRLALTEIYDRVGFYGYHIAEHHSTPLGYAPSPSVYLAAVTQRTHKIKIGPLVYILPLYDPLRLIEEICMLDHLSGGRFQLGVGRGVSPFELAFFNLDPPTAAARYPEALSVVLQGLSCAELNFEGEHYRYARVPMEMRPVQQPHPPLWYGILNPDSAVWAAQNDVNIVTLGVGGPARAITDRYRAEWAARGKKSADLPLLGVSRHIVVAETDEKALRIARRAYPLWRERFVYLWRKNNVPVVSVNAMYPETFDEIQAIGNACAGSPETVRRYVYESAAAAGINYFVSWFAFGDLSFEESATSIELFARHVMPEEAQRG